MSDILLQRQERRPGYGRDGVHPVPAEALSPETSANSKGTSASPETSASSKRWFILIGLVMAAILEVMDTTIINVALPQMAGNLGQTVTDVAWVSTGYILANVIVLPMTAWLSHRFGRKNYLLWSIGIFVAARALCGLSHSLGQLVIWRIIQGGAGAALISTSQATLTEIFPKNQQALVQSIFGLGLGAAPALAPMLGGWITDNYSWQLIFYVHVPIGILSLFLVAIYLPSESSDTSLKADWAGIGLLAVGLGSLQYVLEEGKRFDWFADAWIARFGVMAVVAITLMIVWELSPRNKNPVLDLRVYKDRGLAASVMMSLMLGFGLYGINFAFPNFSQSVLGFTSTKSGLALLPQGLFLAAAIALIGIALQKGIDSRLLIAAGFSIGATGFWLLGHSTPSTSIEDTRISLALQGFGMGALIIPITLAGFAGLKGSQISTGSAQISLGRQLGGSFGIALLNTYISNMTDYHRADLISRTYSGSVPLEERLMGIASNLVGHGYDPTTAKVAALRLVQETIEFQATTKAFDNGFVLIGLVFLAALPLVFLLKKVSSGGASAAPMH